MMIKRGMQVLQRVFMLNCIPMQALHSAYAVAPLTFISSFIPATAWAAPEDCCSRFAPSGDPCVYLEGLKGRQTLALDSHQFENLGSGVADHQSRQACHVPCACSSAYDTAPLTFTAPFISAIVHEVMSMGGARKLRRNSSPFKAIPAEF